MDIEEKGREIAAYLREIFEAVDDSKMCVVEIESFALHEIVKFDDVYAINLDLFKPWQALRFEIRDKASGEHLTFKVKNDSESSGVHVSFSQLFPVFVLCNPGTYEKRLWEDGSDFKMTSNSHEIRIFTFKK